MKCVFLQADTCRLPAIISRLSLTCTFLYSRHHPWVSRLPAGLKGGETSFIALTADLETVLRFSSSSFYLHSNVALMVCLTITSTGIVICTMSGPQEAFFYSKIRCTCNNSWGPKANFCLWALVLWRVCSWVCVWRSIQTRQGLVDQQVPWSGGACCLRRY